MSKIEEKNDNVEVVENTEVVVAESQNEETGLAIFTQARNRVFTSKKLETIDQKIDLYNALEKCDLLLNNCVGTEFILKDFYCEEREVRDDNTGEIKTKYRTILFDINGQTYATGAYGIVNSLQKIVQMFGNPQIKPWENGVKVKVAKRPTKDGKQVLTLTIIK